jgi:DNA-directed RNA polymerase subunit alpha
MEPIYLPEKVEIEEEKDNTTTFSIHPYHPGYGPTVGNALRRVLLSSLPGAAITQVKIDGADHEFTTLDGLKEDLVRLILNLKRIRLSSESEESVEIVLEVKGKKKIKAGDFEVPPEVKISNPDFVIATLTDEEANLVLRCKVEKGRGYAPSEIRDRDEREIGVIAMDAVFTPVQRVSFHVENVRVGQATNYHKLILTIGTDGTVKPIDALKQASQILRDHFAELAGDFESQLTAERPAVLVEEDTELEETEPENTLSLLQLPSRVHNALERVGVTTVEQVLDLSEEQIQDIPGLGQKAVADILENREQFRKVKQEENEA